MEFLQVNDAYHLIHDKVWEKYQENPSLFADTFFSNLEQVKPKMVRVIAYQLYTNGVSLKDLYEQRSTTSLPEFLFSLDIFPSESLMIILKYGFPPFPDGNIFLKWSLQRIGPWLDFALDLALQLGIDLNKINDETGYTILHEAIASGNLPLIIKLLAHRVDPNVKSSQGKTPLSLAVSSPSQPFSLYLEVIKQLVRYRAKPDPETQSLIEASPHREKLERILYSAKKIPTIYCEKSPLLDFLDEIEELALIAETNPGVLTNAKYQEFIRGSNIPVLIKSINDKQKEVIKIKDKILGWPYFINTSSPWVCPVRRDKRIKASSPPGPEKVYKLALKNARNLVPSREIIFTSLTPARNRALTPFLAHGAISPIPEGPLLPTGTPELPTGPA